MTKHVFAAVASLLGWLLETRRRKVMMEKIDPHFNADPGTMSPFQYGEVFVTEGGHDLDLGLCYYARHRYRHGATSLA